MPHPTTANPGGRSHALIAVAILLSAASMSPARAADDPKENSADTVDVAVLRERIKTYLQEGDLDRALQHLNDALDRAPNDATLRREGVDLYLSLARTWMTQEQFNAADRALAAVLKLDPAETTARRLSSVIADARRRLPAQLQQARTWLAVEWFEPAFNTLRQARGLIAQPDSSIDVAFRAAALGAGDDNYFTKSFHKAFYYYDAALQTHDSNDQPSDSLVSRWLQSLVHALADDMGDKSYSESYWRLTLTKAEKHARREQALQPMLVMLRGLAFEASGDATAAAQHYARVAGGQPRGNLSELRTAAQHQLRSFYSPNLSTRRGGAWQRNERDAFTALDTPRFRIFHTDDAIRRQVSVALDFHLQRVVDMAGWQLEELLWPTDIDIYIYPTDSAFTQATKQPPHVTAISRIRRDGNAIADWSIHARATDPLLLASSLPHELFHLLMEANAAAGQIPGALAEGLALHVEPPCRQRQFARLFRAQPQPATLSELISHAAVHPTTPEFYAQSHRLIAVLRERLPFEKITTAVANGASVDELAQRSGYADTLRLQRRYLRVLSEMPN